MVKNIDEFQFERERFDAAKEDSVKRDVDSNVHLNNHEITDLMDLANDAIDKNQFGVAIMYFDRIIGKYDYYQDYNEKGNLLLHLNRLEEALECFDTSINLTENNYGAHLRIALTLLEFLKDDPHDYMMELDLLSNINAACMINKEAMLVKSKIFKELHQFKDSLEFLEEFIKDNPELAQEKHLELLYERADLNFLLKRFRVAFFHFRRILKLDENNADALMSMGLLAQELNKYEYALKCFDEAFDLTNSVSSIIYKGELLIGLHRYEEGIECLKRIPSDLILHDYKQLLQHAENQLNRDNETNYFRITKTESFYRPYVYTFVRNGFRRICGNCYDVGYKLSQFDLKVRPIKYEKEFPVKEHIEYYYILPDEPV